MKNKGFSLIELVVAVAILAIVSMPITSSFVISARLESRATATFLVGNAADDVLLLVTSLEGVEKDAEGANNIKDLLPGSLVQNIAGDTPEAITFRYNGFDVALSLKDCDGFYRVDVCLSCTVDGEERQVTRKGVLRYVAS